MRPIFYFTISIFAISGLMATHLVFSFTIHCLSNLGCFTQKVSAVKSQARNTQEFRGGGFLQQQGLHRSPSAWAVPNYKWHRMHKERWQTPASQHGAPWSAGASQSRGSHVRLGEPKKPTQPDGLCKAWRKAPPDVERWSPIRQHGSGKAGGLVMQSVLVVSLWVH